MRPAKVARREFREALLPVTLRHAKLRVKGYRELWQEAGYGGSLDSLARLPLVTKSIMAAQPDAFRDSEVPTAALQHTGGTTRRPLLMQRGAAELKYIDQFFRVVISESAPKGEAPLCVSVLGDFHGDPTPMPYPGPTLKLNVNDSYWDVEEIFSAPDRVIGRKIEDIILVGLESQLRILTCRLIERGYDFATSRVRSVHSTGDLITRRLRKFYEATWRCALTSRYSMSEVVGGAELCSLCGYYHCDTHLIGEVVDPKTGKVVDSGVGILTLTCLYPFVQKQPIIRYRTGDVVELGPTTCAIDDLAFRLRGREMHAVFDPDSSPTKALLFGSEVYDVLDQFPDVAASKFAHVFPSLDSLPNLEDLGHLKYSVSMVPESPRPMIDMQVGLRYSSYLYPDAAAGVLEAIRTAILNRHSHLASRIDRGEIEFRVRAADASRLSHVQVDEVE